MRSPTITLRLATRGSRLALAQSRQVGDLLEAAHDGLRVELVTIVTSGDRIRDRPLADAGGKGLFTKEIEVALLDGEADFAVHSYKDVPTTMPLVSEAKAKLVMAAVPRRQDVRDALVARGPASLEALPRGARVGTTSPRRRAQLESARPDVRVVPLRGNVDTRLGRVAEGELDAALLAMAGLKRSGLWDAPPAGVMISPLPVEAMLPAAGQGALALQCRRDDAYTRERLGVLDDPTSRRCVEAERRLVAELEGDCFSPIGALAEVAGEALRLRGCLGTPAGVLFSEAVGDVAGAARAVARSLRERA